MKIKVKEADYEKVLLMKKDKNFKPVKPALFWRFLIKTLGKKDLKETGFTYQNIGMENLKKDEPCLVLMNHSSFIDLEIAETVLYPRPLNIVCTSDGFVGKNFLMRRIGCIPTNKFVPDFLLLKNMKYTVTELKSSILMYPEASYSFDGTATPLPDSLGKFLKILNVPVVMIKTYGAFARDPLYNNLQKRSVKVSADVKYLLSVEDIQKKTPEELNEILKSEFTFDNWKWQQENNIKISENFRSDFLNRVLYKCCKCGCENKMEGKGIHLICKNCSSKWELSEAGFLVHEENSSDKNIAVLKNNFIHIPDWFKWQREKVKEEINSENYNLETEVEIFMMVNTKAIYHVGNGKLVHNKNGFFLEGCNGKLHYEQKPKASYSLYSDYFWYELGDMICIGDMKVLYYCFPKNGSDIVAKTRIATEELYKENF